MQDMTEKEARELLGASHLGYLALASGAAAYAIPVYYGYDGQSCYFQCHPGKKDEFLDATEEACFVVAHYESEHVWESVHVVGPVEKLTLTDDLTAAKDALLGVPYPPMPGHFPHGMPIRDSRKMYYLRLSPTRIAGKKSAFRRSEAA